MIKFSVFFRFGGRLFHLLLGDFAVKRIIPLLFLMCMLSSCVSVDISREDNTVTTSEMTAEVITTTAPSSEADVISLPTESVEDIQTDTQATAEDEPALPTFAFPEEFYSELKALFAEYSINRNCDGDPISCTCNPEYEQVDADGNITTPRDRCMSVYFLDIESGYEMSVNTGVHYPVASVVKIPFCNMIYRKLANGEIDPDFEITYEKRHQFHGTGVVNKGNYGDVYTVSQLLKLAITESDNTAYEMLKDLVSWDEFVEYCQDIGYTHEQDLRKLKQKLCVESASAAGRDMADFITSDSEYVDTYKYDLTHTKNRMIKSSYTVYRKYGWTNFAFHDVAYVDAPHPYVLVILSNLEGEDKSDYRLFASVTALVEKYSQESRELI